MLKIKNKIQVDFENNTKSHKIQGSLSVSENNHKLYNSYSDFLKNKYNEKTYKIPVNLPLTCPNRDGSCGTGGCTFCGDKAAGFESLSDMISVKDQLIQNMDYIGKKYNAKKFIAYFQNFTNTYMPPAQFEKHIKDAVMDNVVEISVSTRPDAVDRRYLDILSDIRKEANVDITIELGLQSINHRTLSKINRGHSLAEFLEAAILVKSYGFELVVHMILNLPYDDKEDIIEGAKILSAVKTDAVKLHSLYIVHDTKMQEEYEKGEIDLKTADDYIEKAAFFLAYLDPQIVVQRLVARAPKEDTVFCNYGISWWKIKDMIEEYMLEKGLYQGIYFDYLGGRAVKKF